VEERLSDKSEVERAKDEESIRCRKLMKLAEKYKRELNEAHVELRDLRARCLTTSEIQVFTAFNCITCNYDCRDPSFDQSVNTRFVGHRYMTHPGAPTIVSDKHNQTVHF